MVREGNDLQGATWRAYPRKSQATIPKPRRYGFSILVDAFWLMLVHLVSELRIAAVRAMAELLIRSPTFPLGGVDTYPSIPAHAGIHFHTAPRAAKRGATYPRAVARFPSPRRGS